MRGGFFQKPPLLCKSVSDISCGVSGNAIYKWTVKIFIEVKIIKLY